MISLAPLASRPYPSTSHLWLSTFYLQGTRFAFSRAYNRRYEVCDPDRDKVAVPGARRPPHGYESLAITIFITRIFHVQSFCQVGERHGNAVVLERTRNASGSRTVNEIIMLRILGILG